MTVDVRKTKKHGITEKIYVFNFYNDKEVENFIIGLELVCRDNYIVQRLKTRITDKYSSKESGVCASTMLFQGEIIPFMELFLDYNFATVELIQKFIETIDLWKENDKMNKNMLQLYGIDLPSTEELSEENNE